MASAPQGLIATAEHLPRHRAEGGRRTRRRPSLGRASQEGTSVRRIVTFGLFTLALPVVAGAQTKDDFAGGLGSERKRRLDVC